VDEGVEWKRAVELLALLTPVAVAAVLRFSTLGTQSYWSDEAVTVALVTKGFGGMMRAIPHTEATPPLYYALAWLWSRLFGTGAVALRSLSAIAGTLTVPLAYAAARSVAGRAAAFAVALLVAVNPLLVWYSQEARAYALFAALVSLSFLFFVRVLLRPSGTTLALWAAASILALATHYFAVFVVACEAAWLLARRRGRATSAAVAGVAVALAALAPLALAQRATGNPGWISRGPLAKRSAVAVKEFLVGRDAPWDKVFAVACAVALLTACLAGCRRSRASRTALAPAAVIGLGALALPFVLALLGLDYFVTQNDLGALLPLLIAVGIAAAAAPRAIGAAAIAIVAVLSITLVVGVAGNRAYHRTDWRGAARAIDTVHRRIVVVAPDYGGSFARLPLRLYLSDTRAVDRGYLDVTAQYRYLAATPCDADGRRAFRVREIVVVSFNVPLAVKVPRGFRLVETLDTQEFALRRYRSPAPVAVSAARLVRRPPNYAAVLLEQPGAGPCVSR
jgi:mannosyltransferase